MTRHNSTYLFGTHMTALIDALSVTKGPVVELGAGFYSTPLLHWWCASRRRRLVSFESDLNFYEYAKQYACDWHDVIHVTDWDSIDLTPLWAVALVDHGKERRRIEMDRLRHAEYVVLHDTNQRYLRRKRIHGYRYRAVYPHPGAETTVFSNQHAPRYLGTQFDLVGEQVPPLRIVTHSEMNDIQRGPHRRLTMCRAIREVYTQLTDPLLKKKLRYACSLAEVITAKIERHDPGWLKRFYPRRSQFERIMGDIADG